MRIPIAGFGASGGVRVLTQMANALADDGWRVEFTAPDYASDPHFPLSESVQIKVIRTYGFNRPMRLLYYLMWLCLFACRDAAACVANYYLTAFPIYISHRLHRRQTKLVYLVQHDEPTAHVKFGRSKFLPVRYILYQLAYRSYQLPYQIITVSDWIKAQIGRDDATVIPNGVNPDLFYPDWSRASVPPVVGTIGRQHAIKGFDVFLAGIGSLPARSDVNIRVLSDQALTLPAQVEQIHPAHDHSVREFYQSCTIFVFTSRLEGFGLPPLEAMACGIPVITTDCGGVRTYASPENSLIIPIDDPEALQAAILRLLQDDQLRQQLSENGLATARSYSLEQFRARYQLFFRQLLNRET